MPDGANIQSETQHFDFPMDIHVECPLSDGDTPVRCLRLFIGKKAKDGLTVVDTMPIPKDWSVKEVFLVVKDGKAFWHSCEIDGVLDYIPTVDCEELDEIFYEDCRIFEVSFDVEDFSIETAREITDDYYFESDMYEAVSEQMSWDAHFQSYGSPQ